MAAPATMNISFVRGDTEVIVVTITNDGTTPVDITGRTYRAQVRKTKDATAYVAFDCAVTNAAGGVVTCTLSAGNSSNLDAGISYWDFEEANGAVVTTILAGTVKVLADVTR